MTAVSECCQKTGIFIAVEELANKLNVICDRNSNLQHILANEESMKKYIDPIKIFFEKSYNFLHSQEFEMLIYTNGFSNIEPYPLPNIPGIHFDVEFLCSKLNCSKDFMLELINIANLRKERYISLDLIPISLILFENFNQNIYTILNYISDSVNINSAVSALTGCRRNFITQIQTAENEIIDEILFNKIFNQFCYINSREIITQIVLPLTKRQVPFKSSKTFQVNENLQYWLFEINSIYINQKNLLHEILIKFSQKVKIRDEILHKMISIFPDFGNSNLKCYDISDAWNFPFIFNKFSLSQFSLDFYSPISMVSPELFFLTSFECLLYTLENFSFNADDKLFDLCYTLLLNSSGHINIISSSLMNSPSKPFKISDSFSSLLGLIVLISVQKYLDRAEIQEAQRQKLLTINIDRLLINVVNLGAFIWLRRILFENQDIISIKTCRLVNNLFIDFLLTFGNTVTSWYRLINNSDLESKNDLDFNLRNIFLFICDFYGCLKYQKFFNTENMISQFYECLDLKSMSITFPNDNSPASRNKIILIDFIIKMIAMSGKFFMLESCAYAIFGLSNSSNSSTVFSYLLDKPNMQALLSGFNPNAASECSTFINWSNIFKMISDLPLFAEKVILLKIGTKLFNGSVPFSIITLISKIFQTSPHIINEICSAGNYELINNVVKYILTDDITNLKHALWNLLTESIQSNQICYHVVHLLDRVDFRPEPLRITEPVPLQNDFIKHSIVCTSFFINLKTDTFCTIYYFLKFSNRLLTNIIYPTENSFFKSSKIVKIYISFILMEIFTNINDRTYISDLYKWKIIKYCLEIFIQILNCFPGKFELRKLILMGFTNVPISPLSLDEIITACAIDILCTFYQNNLTTKTLFEIIRIGLSTTSSVSSSPSLLRIIHKVISLSFELIVTVINLETPTLTTKGTIQPSILLIPLSHTISNSRTQNDSMPILSLFSKILLNLDIDSKTIDNLSKVLSFCLKIPGVEDIFINRLNNQSIDSQKILHKISSVWEPSGYITTARINQTVSVANLIIHLFDCSFFNTVECILYGSKISDSTIYETKDACSDYFTYHYYVTFSAILRVFYKSTIIQEHSSSLKIYERVVTIIALCLSHQPYRVFILPLLRTLFNYDFSYYILNILNNGIHDLRQRFNTDTRKSINSLLLFLGSIMNIVATDLKESTKSKDSDRVDRLLNILCYESINNTSFVVQLTKFAIQLPDQFPTTDISGISFIDFETVNSLAKECSEEMSDIVPKSILDSRPKLINLKLFSHALKAHSFHNRSLSYINSGQNEEFDIFLKWAKEKNACDISNYSKYYLLDSILYCFSSMLCTRSDSLRTLYNSDQELLAIVCLILETSFVNAEYSNVNIICQQFRLFSTILCLTSFESFISISFKNLSLLCLPQNLSRIADHLFGYRLKTEASVLYSPDFKASYYSSLLYLKLTCYKLTKYWYMNKEVNPEDAVSFTKPFLDINTKIINGLVEEKMISYILNDLVSDDINLNSICLEIFLMLIRSNALIGDIPIAEYLLYIDFYDILISLIKTKAPIYNSMINGTEKEDRNFTRNFILIVNCFLLISNTPIGVNIIYRCNFINILSESNILDFPTNLLSQKSDNKDMLKFRQNVFQKVYCISLDTLCNAMRQGTSLQQDIISMACKLFAKNVHSFKSILEYSANSNVSENSAAFTLSPSLIHLLKQSLQFCSDLAMYKNQTLSISLNPSHHINSKLDSTQFEGLKDLFEPFILLLQKFSSSKSLLNISYFYLKDLFSQKKKEFRNDSLTVDTFDKFDPPPFSIKTIKTIKDILLIQTFIVRYYQQFIVSFENCDQPVLSELIFYPDKYSSISESNRPSSLDSHFNNSSTSSFRKPSITYLLNLLESIIGWRLIIETALKKITQSKNIKDFNLELSQIITLHSKWGRLLSTLPNEKRQEFTQRRLIKLEAKYDKVLGFCNQLMDRTLFIILIHAKFYEQRFLTKLTELHTSQVLFKHDRIYEMIQILLTKDEEARIIGEFVQHIKNFFNKDFCSKFRDKIKNKTKETEFFSQNVIEYFENYIIPTS